MWCGQLLPILPHPTEDWLHKFQEDNFLKRKQQEKQTTNKQIPGLGTFSLHRCEKIYFCGSLNHPNYCRLDPECFPRACMLKACCSKEVVGAVGSLQISWVNLFSSSPYSMRLRFCSAMCFCYAMLLCPGPKPLGPPTVDGNL